MRNTKKLVQEEASKRPTKEGRTKERRAKEGGEEGRTKEGGEEGRTKEGSEKSKPAKEFPLTVYQELKTCTKFLKIIKG